jgi:hypothetical protein
MKKRLSIYGILMLMIGSIAYAQERSDQKCENCHSVQGWQISNFNHDKTGFPLRGSHKIVNCKSCHKSGKFMEKIDRLCGSCHNDVHAGKLGKLCESCHNESGWKKSFTIEMHRRTNFPLTGRHALIPCQECHRDSRDRGFTRVPVSCYSCHQADYLSTSSNGSIDHATAGFSTRCQSCHRANAWVPVMGFQDHNRCFPISAGPHSGIKCQNCHTNLNGLGSVDNCNSGTFVCGSCHSGAHSLSKMNNSHSGVPGYQYTDQKCYECHPKGRS